MSREQKLVAAWVGSGGIVMIVVPKGGVGAVLGGLIPLVWGVAISLNYRGLAQSMPARLFWIERSVPWYRMAFAWFAFVGLVLVVGGIYGLT